MSNPVPGVFRVSSAYTRGAHVILTGVLSGEGVPPQPAEAPVGNFHDRYRHSVSPDLPVVVDQSNPSKFAILWDDVPQLTAQQRARILAERAAATAAGMPAPGPDVTFGGAGVLDAQAVLGGMPDLSSLLGNVLGSGAAARAGIPVTTSTSSVRTRVVVNGVPVSDTTEVNGVPVTSADVRLPLVALMNGAGHAAEAVILAAHEVSESDWPAGARPPLGYLNIAFDVAGPEGARWAATALVGFANAERKTALSVIGSTVPVRFDPSDRTNVAPDLTAMGGLG